MTHCEIKDLVQLCFGLAGAEQQSNNSIDFNKYIVNDFNLNF